MDRQPENMYVWEWKEAFNPLILDDGRQDEESGKIMSFTSDPMGHWARAMTSSGHKPVVRIAPVSIEEFRKYPRWTDLHTGTSGNLNDRYYFGQYYGCNCIPGQNGARCRHLASLLYHWEKTEGPFVMFPERTVTVERAKKLEEARRTYARQEEIKKKKKTVMYASQGVQEYVKDLPAPDGLMFQPDTALVASKVLTSQYEVEVAGELLNSARIFVEMKTQYDEQGNQVIQSVGKVGKETTTIRFAQNEIRKARCSCGDCYWRDTTQWFDMLPNRFCAHLLAHFVRARERIFIENPGDMTDCRADSLLSMLSDAKSPAAIDDVEPDTGEKRYVTLAPRILRDGADSLKLGFDIGRKGERQYAVKSLEKLVTAVDGKAEFSLSKTTTLDFASDVFDEHAEKWYRLITSRIRSVQKVNNQLSRSNRYDYYGSSKELSVGSGIPLEESDLDVVYNLVRPDGKIQYQYGGRKDVDIVPVGETESEIRVRLNPISTNDKLSGISMTVELPHILQGSQYFYILDDHGFGRVSEENIGHLRMFRKAGGSSGGTYKCIIGQKKFAEFYYRTLPVLQKASDIRLEDHVTPLLEKLLPAEAAFTFYIDLVDDTEMTCAPRVRYDDVTFPVGFISQENRERLRDMDQENRVQEVVSRLFPERDDSEQQYRTEVDEDTKLSILTDGVALLSAYGEVKGSEAFHRVHFRPAPSTRISVSIDSDLLDLSIQTRDMSEEELLELLNSYRKRKKWYRLKNGDYINLQDSEELKELQSALSEMDVDLEDLIRGGARLPLYRSLYVDKLLEDHEKLVSSRDREFKALIRSFQTIRDSDFEVPEKLADVVRPYQQYGFRWLSTLAQCGFGGILADEMGLGKTIQMLAVLQMRQDNGDTRPSLVVCPASLVFNWKEECRKFTPDMPVDTLADTLPYRKKKFEELRNGNGTGLYITSYDLLKRDIPLYDGIHFSVVILDEAQYVKNAHTAVARAVKVLRADQRYALTGTPIENRLSELWSIFDFLMPGFLYSAHDFAEKFETPIMKHHDEAATDRLARMTEPFILRRKKADVLKELPEKLEETRSTEMQEDQRKLYDAQVVHMREILYGTGNSGEDKMRILAEITRLRQICCDPSLLFENYHGSSTKREACLELIQNAIDGGHRMLVFSQFTSMLALLQKDLEANGIEYYLITGATAKQERLRLVNEFNEGSVPVFLISLKAGGTGLNLVGADVVIHYDPWWNLAVQNQATDRAHRIGQTRQVTVIKLITSGTIEEKIAELQEAKRELADAIISGEGSSLMSLTREELMALIE